MTVADIARKDVVTATIDMTVAELADRMRESSVGSLVILEEGDPVGLVTDRDIAVRVVAEERSPTEVTAQDIMTGDLVTVTPETGVFQVTELLAQENVRRLPVVDDGELVGIVALDDLMVLLSGELENLAGVVAAEAPPY
jgi:CBS domain-containing protein